MKDIKSLKIYIAGHRGMVGSAVVRELVRSGYSNLIFKSSYELDLRNQNAVNMFFESEKPDVVIDAAARVGGILANNNYPYQFLMENMQIQNNLIDTSLEHNVEKFIFLGSSCIYPKFCPQPIKEEYLLTSSLESTNQWYAIAKISGVKACEAIKRQFGKEFIGLMPTNMYGFFDNFDLHTSHVLPAMLRKFHEAKLKGGPVVLWGSGLAMREFLFVDDFAKAVVFSIENKLTESIYNVGTGIDVEIRELARVISEIVGYSGEVIWDKTKPDGTPRKLLDVGKINNLGWKYKTELKDGIKMTYDWFMKNEDSIREMKL